MAYVPMIHPDTGEIDHLAVAERAQLRAARSATEWCMDRAQSERYDWRRSRNLPDDRPMCSVAVPEWGNSGDSFGAR